MTNWLCDNLSHSTTIPLPLGCSEEENMKKIKITLGFGLFTLLGCTTAQASCGSAFCSINTNWDEHSASQPGWSADLRFSYSRADTLRSGSKKISVDPTDPDSAGEEVENLRTVNQIVTTNVNYTYNDNWGVMLSLPYIKRDHNHSIGDPNPALVGYESFHASSLGDIKLIGRYRWEADNSGYSNIGVKFGLKLATGKKDFEIEQTGEVPEEVTLQPGNGSTDLILGLFWSQSTPGNDWSWFAQATAQDSIQSDAEFTPGTKINIDVGTRYAINADLSGLLQLNAQWNKADSGDAAAVTDTGEASSGGKTVSLTPGLRYTIATDTQLYALIQLPIYQYVNGEQLTADSSYSAGISHRF
jgi:hypothetical protein